MRERQGVIAIPEGWNIRTASEMSNKKTNPLWKHCTLEHGGEKVDFTMTALRSFRNMTKYAKYAYLGAHIAQYGQVGCP